MKDYAYLYYRLFFRALSNKTRFGIINLLREGPKTVTEISKSLKFEQSRVSHNLKKLEQCGFVSSERKGKNKIYSIDREYIVPVLKNLEKYIDKYKKKLNKCNIK